MPCPIEQIKLYALGDRLQSQEVARIRVHVDACRSCRSLLDQEAALTEELRRLEQITVPPDFSAVIMQKIRACARGVFASRMEWRVAMALAMGMLFFGGLFVLSDQGLRLAGAAALDEFILQGFAAVADLLLFGLMAAVSVGQAAVQLSQILSGLLLALGRWLFTLPPLWLLTAFSLFALSNGTLFWILRRPPGAWKQNL